MTYLNIDTIQEFEKMQESEWIKIGVVTQVQERRHGLRVSRMELRFLVTVISLTGQQLENLSKSGKRMQIVGCDDWGSNFKIRGVQAPVCKPLLSVGEYTTKGGVTVLYGDKGYMFHKRFEC